MEVAVTNGFLSWFGACKIDASLEVVTSGTACIRVSNTSCRSASNIGKLVTTTKCEKAIPARRRETFYSANAAH